MWTGCTEQVEALVRWPHPERGFVLPSEFILLAEQTGLIEPLTRWVLKEALRQCKVWHETGLDIRVAVNLSARNLLHPDLPRLVARLLGTHAVQPAWLELEITESAVMTDPARALQTLTRLHEMGLRISIDDFGAGYSSLGYLKRLPVDTIKIDKSFVLDMLHDESAATIVRSTIRLGHELGLQMVTEGVENQETWEVLVDMGCDLAQGHYLSRPLPAQDCSAWLRRQSAATGSDSGEPSVMTRPEGVVRPVQLRRRA
jgi:EAL domain-containing protein (putative c-di-GMP-specific phosphodiesterase class I)